MLHWQELRTLQREDKNQDNICIYLSYDTKKVFLFFQNIFSLISLHFVLCKLHMDIGTCHLSLVSPLYAAKLVLSYMLHRDTGRAQSKMTQPSYLSPHPPTSQHSLSQQTHPVHCWAPKWQGPCSPSEGVILVLSQNNIYFIWHSENWKPLGLSSYLVPHKDQHLKMIRMSSCPFDFPTLNLFFP